MVLPKENTISFTKWKWICVKTEGTEKVVHKNLICNDTEGHVF